MRRLRLAEGSVKDENINKSYPLSGRKIVDHRAQRVNTLPYTDNKRKSKQPYKKEHNEVKKAYS